jgi:hypothetical protein
MITPIRKRIIDLFIIVTTFSLVAAPALANTKEKRSTLDDQYGVAVTIYNENLALVKDQRKISLDQGLNFLAFRDVSSRMRPETALLRSLNHAGSLSVIEQNFDFDLLTPAKMLEKYVGRNVGIIKTHPRTGKETRVEATVLSVNNGVVLKIGDRIETGVPGRIVFDKVPANLRDRPTLVMQLNNDSASKQDVELSYLTGGLSWKADYVAELSADDSHINLTGWVTLNNTSGTTYKNAKLQLVAGDVNRAPVARDYSMALESRAPMKYARAAKMKQETLFEYHMYSLGRPTTVANNQTKQVSLLSASSVPVKKEFLLKGKDYYYRSSYGDLGQKLKVGVFVELQNKESHSLGMPLPKGVVRVYKKDQSGNAQFIGEDRIDHTPKNETAKLKLGNAFDITAHKKQTRFRKHKAEGKYNYAYESSFELVLKNAKSEAVTVRVLEPVPGDWKMQSSSHKYKRAAAGTAEWNVKIPAEGTTQLKYRVLVRY